MTIELESKEITQLPVKQLVPINYQRTILQNIIDAQNLTIKALQKDVKTLAKAVEDLQP